MTTETPSETDAYLDSAARPWTLWEHRDGALDFETYPTLREAVEAAQMHEDWGHASFERIEGPGTHKEIAAMWVTVYDDLRAAERAQRDERYALPKPEWVVQVSLPAGVGWTEPGRADIGRRTLTIRVAWEHDRAAADADAARWVRRVGADRVTVLPATAP